MWINLKASKESKMPSEGYPCFSSERQQWQPVTPAMAARLTDHVWMMDEWLSVRVPPKHLW
jgi:hypothetical protein